MQDLDYSIAEVIKENLIKYGIEFEEKRSGSNLYILVENDNLLVVFVIYGFFEEYVLYSRKEGEERWHLVSRKEYNIFSSVRDILVFDLGITINDE